MVSYDTVEFDTNESTKEIAKLAGNSKQPSAWALENEDEKAPAATVMKLCPVTACDDMELTEVILTFLALCWDEMVATHLVMFTGGNWVLAP